ncbi:hypothetical protein P700755_001549 [Psychroflexus torquis ATCC 700755]|uniref:Uncharacterized protein n=1 Tax=Psychroflexus torquis (strain ATCC 700755 / CIP 106069 / ACAM 623) TaxID=313595 RepID=K4IDE9_PSYTT|nr:hypothetical protein P700755_001549 [Psychroflexus torquis ATCC 700755]
MYLPQLFLGFNLASGDHKLNLHQFKVSKFMVFSFILATKI